MITLTERNRITKVILTTQDETVIRKIESIISSAQPDIEKDKTEREGMLDWDTLPAKIKKGIEKSLKQSETGQTIPHNEVMKKYQKWLKK